MTTMKPCPFCAEDILAAAVVCKHCRQRVTPANAAFATPLPFTPIPGATPVSAWLYFLGWIVLWIGSIMISPQLGVLFVFGMLASMIWTGIDARTHQLDAYESKLSSPTQAVIGVVLLWGIFFPYYLGVRSRIRAGVQPLRVVR